MYSRVHLEIFSRRAANRQKQLRRENLWLILTANVSGENKGVHGHAQRGIPINEVLLVWKCAITVLSGN